jgi:hypothetical protein
MSVPHLPITGSSRGRGFLPQSPGAEAPSPRSALARIQGALSGHEAPPPLRRQRPGVGALACFTKNIREACLRRLFCPLFAVVVVVGCQSTPANQPAPAPLVARFYLETKPDEAGVPIRLPQSGVVIRIAPKPVFVEYDLVNAEIAQVELGRCLLLQLTPAAARDLYRLSVAANGRRLVLALNDAFLGARRIEPAMSDGVILVFIESPDEQLPELVARLKRTADDLARAAQKTKSG